MIYESKTKRWAAIVFAGMGTFLFMVANQNVVDVAITEVLKWLGSLV